MGTRLVVTTSELKTIRLKKSNIWWYNTLAGTVDGIVVPTTFFFLHFNNYSKKDLAKDKNKNSAWSFFNSMDELSSKVGVLILDLPFNFEISNNVLISPKQFFRNQKYS